MERKQNIEEIFENAKEPHPNEYVAAFFRSDLGKIVLQSLTSGKVILHLNQSDLDPKKA
jgi:hypothetical protein